jgi:pimeloyl-ACP methyl ester carboxylesterase
LGKRISNNWVAIAIGAAVLCGLARPAQCAIQLEDCRLESAVVPGAVSARCGWYEVAENRDSASSKRIRIRVVIVPALRRQPLPDPIFILSGGPGQAASDFYLSAGHAFEELRRDRDLVIVDQRGTGRSHRLDCKLPDDLETARFDEEAIKTYTRDCLAKLDGDPRFYSTSVAVRDLDEIRAALGYQKIDLYGISYGTRVAQHYLRRYPGNVRAIVLDGVVPVDVALGPEVAPAAQTALDAILDRCLSQPDCQKTFPAVKDELNQLQARLSRGPVVISVPDPRTAEAKRVDFSYVHLATALRLHSYSDDTASLLPFLIHEAARDRPQSMAAQALLVARDLEEQLANGMHNAVVCTEDVPFIKPEALNDPAIDRSYLRRYFIETLKAICSEWPRGVIDNDLHAPLSSDAPALLLSGSNDPVTPNEYGERAARSYKNSKHIVVEGHGHGQLTNPCIAQVITKFVDRASNAQLDTACVTKQIAAPFMLSATGPGP